MALLRLLACALLVGASAFGSAPVSVWPVDSLVKIFQDDAADKNRAADQAWLVPRNGHASIQFAVRGSEAVDAALATGFASGTARVQRLDGRGPVEVFYATFTTKTAGMPFIATVIAPLAD